MEKNKNTVFTEGFMMCGIESLVKTEMLLFF